MASLHYKFATMNSGKSTQLIQAHFNYLERGMHPLAMTPAIVAYLFSQRWVMESVTQGAVKG